MSATAQFHRERAADFDDANLVAVVLTEECHRTHRLGLVEIRDKCVDRVVRRHGFVGECLDVLLLGVGQRALPREVEAEVTRLVERARLHRVGAEHLTQRRVHHVGTGVPLGCTLAPLGVDVREHDVALGDLALLHRHLVRPDLLGDLLHVVDLGFEARRGERTDVGDLSTGLCVERAAVEDDLDVLTGLRDRDTDAVDDQCEDVSLGDELVETGELGGTSVEQFLVDREVGMGVLARLSVVLGALALLGHERAEAVLVHGETGLGRHLEREVDREAVGVVQCKRLIAGDDRLSGRLDRLGSILEQSRTRSQRLEERGLLADGNVLDAREVGFQNRVRRRHRVADDDHELAHGGLLAAEQFGRTHDATQQPAQDVAAAVVAGVHTVGDQHRCGACVVGDDAETDV